MSKHFPTVYADLPTLRLLEIFEQGPARIREAVETLPSDALKARPRGRGTWSVIEIVHHLADAEIVGAARIRQTLAEPDAALVAYHPDRWADAMGYQNRNAESFTAVLKLFELLRHATGVLFHEARPEDWPKPATHPTWGPVTLRHLLELYADHSERHLEQILHIRQILGRPLEMHLLLQRRLY